MTQTITLPDLWLLVAPCGCFDGWMRATHEGVATRASADVAWLDFEANKRKRERMRSEGWVVRGGEYAEWNDSDKGHCKHIPKWGIGAQKASGQQAHQEASLFDLAVVGSTPEGQKDAQP